MIAAFPASVGAMKPLKLGIQRDILDLKIQPRPANIWLRRALALHANRSVYLLKIKAGDARVDLEGNTVGDITENEELGAIERLKEIRTKSKARKPTPQKPLNTGKSNPVKKPLLTLKKGEVR